MSKKWNRVLSFLLAIALVFTTFGSDFASANVYAAEEEQQVEANENAPAAEESTEADEVTEETLPEIFEYFEQEEAAEEATAVEEAAAEGSNEEAVIEEAAEEAGEAGQAATEEDAAATEDSTEDAAAEASSEDAAAEASSEDAAAEASSEEVVKKDALSTEPVSDSYEIDDIKIELSAEAGILPADAVLQVEKVSEEEESVITDTIASEENVEAEAVKTFSYDINIYSPSLRTCVQPKGYVDIKFSKIKMAADENVGLSVYHVADSLDSAKAMVDAGNEATSAEFNTNHFSIYSVTLTYEGYYNDYDFTFNAYLVDENGDAINKEITSVPLTIQYGQALELTDIAPKIEGYKYERCVRFAQWDLLNVLGIGGQIVHYLKLSYDWLHGYHVYACQRGFSLAQPEIAGINSGTYFLVYSKEKTQDLTKTDDHLDLGFTDVNEYSKYYNGGATVYAKVGNKVGPMYPIGYDNGTKTYEYRLYLGNYSKYDVYSKIPTVSVNDSITFFVDYNYKTYKKESTTQLNQEASDRCFKAHKDEQDIFGFDYEFSFTEEFVPEADVIYYANYAVPEGKDYKYEVTIKKWDRNNKAKHEVLSYSDTKLPARDGFKFLGWSTDKNSTKADPKYDKKKKVDVTKGKKLELYAVWESTVDKTSDHLDLGFTDYEEYAMYYNGGAQVYAIINDKKIEKPMYPTGFDDGTKTYEYRLYLGNYKNSTKYSQRYSGVESVSVKDKIEFVVVYKGQEYTKNATEQNQIASDFCKTSHPTQKIWGFDYKFSFTDQFELKGDVFYYPGYTVPKTELQVVGKEVTWKYGEQYGQHKVLTYAETELYDHNDGYTFAGWKTTENGKDVVYKPGAVIKLKEGEKKHLTAIWEAKDVYVAVYATDGTGSTIPNKQLGDLLGLTTVQDDGYYPVGVIKLPASLFANKNEPYIKNHNDFLTVMSAFSAIDLTHNGGVNASNTVASNLGYVQEDWNGTAGSQKTALFIWHRNWGQSKTISYPGTDRTDFAYHLDLRFATNTVEYIGVYPDGTTENLAKKAYLTDTTVKVPDASAFTFTSEDYFTDGFYKDKKLTQVYPEATGQIKKDAVVYVKLSELHPEVTVTYHANYAGSEADKPYTEKSNKDYYFKAYKGENGVFTAEKPGAEFAGWYKAADGNDEYDAKIYLTESIDVYAHWDDIDYTTKYVDDDENETVLGSLVQHYGEGTYTLDKDPVNSDENFSFVGWDDLGTTSVKETLSSETIAATTVSGSKTFKAVYDQTQWDAYFQVYYYYQDKKGGYPAAEDAEKSSVRSMKVGVDPTTCEVNADDKNKTQDGKYSLVDEDELGKWSDTISKTNGKKNPVILSVYYARPNTGLTLTITAPEGKKDYDGTALTTAGADPKSITLKNDKDQDVTFTQGTAEFTYTGSEVNAGTHKDVNKIDTFKIVINGQTYTQASIDKDGNVTDPDLDIDKIVLVANDLIINPLTVSLTVPNDGRDYNGKEFKADEYQFSDKIERIDSSKVVKVELDKLRVSIPTGIIGVTDSKKATDEIDLVFDAVKIGNVTLTKDDYVVRYADSATQSATANVTIHITKGDLVITPVAVTLKSADLEQEYTGFPLVNGEKPLQIEYGWVGEEGAIYKFTGSQTEIGFYEKANTFEIVKAKDNTDLSNYVFEKDGKSLISYGDMTIKDPKKWDMKIAITTDVDGGNEKIVKYNGETQHIDVDVDIQIKASSADDNTTPVIPTPTPTPSSNTFTEIISNVVGSLGSIFTIKADAAGDKHLLPDLPKDITIQHDGKSYTYRVDNVYLEGGEGVFVKEGGYPAMLYLQSITIRPKLGDGLYGDDISDLVIDKSDWTKMLTADENTTDVVVDNGIQVGKLTVIPREVTLTSGDATRTYDGKECKNWDDPAESWPEDQTFGFVVDKQTGERLDKVIITNTTSIVGERNKKTTAPNEFTYEFVNKDMAVNYDVTTQFGTLTVNPVKNEQRNDDPPTQREDTVETPAAPGQVLGAQRAEGAVLGARRGGTEDPTNNVARVIVIVIAAGIAVSIMFFGKKKEDSEE